MLLYNKLFVGGKWSIVYREYSVGKQEDYKKIEVPNGQWIADPFLYEVANRHYLFCEQYFCDKHRAGIGVFEFVNGIPDNNSVIIENNYHMSYPCVFSFGGQHFLIPESSANHTLDLYVANDFPYGWQHLTTLLKDITIVDTTVHIQNDTVFLMGYQVIKGKMQLVVYHLDMLLFTMKKMFSKEYVENVGRPAGRLFVGKDGKWYRPAQNSKKKYGESLLFYEVLHLSDKKIEERLAQTLCPENVPFSEKVDRVHTYGRDSMYEVIDIFQERFDFLHAPKILMRKFF